MYRTENPVFNRVCCGEQKIFPLGQAGSQTFEIPEEATHIGLRAGKFGFFKSDHDSDWKTKGSHRFIKIASGAKKVEVVFNNKASGWTYEVKWEF